MRLPAGRARPFKQDMIGLVNFLKSDLRRTFEGDAYQRAATQLMRELDNQRAAILQEFDQRARPQGFALARSEQQGLFVTPIGPQGEPATAEELAALSDEQRAALEQAQPAVEDDFNAVLRRVHDLELDARAKLQELDRQTAASTIDPRARSIDRALSAPIARKWPTIWKKCAPTSSTHAADFRDGSIEPAEEPGDEPAIDPLLRFQVNVLVDHSRDARRADRVRDESDVHESDRPHRARCAAGRERAGLHHAARRGAASRQRRLSGAARRRCAERRQRLGCLEARLADAARSSSKIPGTHLQMFSTRTLESEPIPLDVKVMLLGTPRLVLRSLSVRRGICAAVQGQGGVRVRDDAHAGERAGLRVVCAGALRRAPSAAVRCRRGGADRRVWFAGWPKIRQKLSTQFGDIADLIIEAAHWARKADRAVVSAADVRKALDEWRYRSNLIEEETQQPITDGTIKIEVEGEVVGQINGLTVIEYGEYQFGHPSRISARIYVGRSGVMVIEREVHLSGRIHNKGVLTLEGYLHGQYATKEPLSLAASLSFEQNYSEIEGDSASSTELYALLSALADLPIKQGIAVTGSVDQQGRVQPVGGVQYKIEGLLRHVPGARLDGRAGRDDPGEQRART